VKKNWKHWTAFAQPWGKNTVEEKKLVETASPKRRCAGMSSEWTKKGGISEEGNGYVQS